MLYRDCTLILLLCLLLPKPSIKAQSLEWIKHQPDTEIKDVAKDAAGNLYVTGHSGASNNNHNILIRKYSPLGQLLFSMELGGSDQDFGEALALDGQGRFYVTGSFRTPSVDFDPGPGIDMIEIDQTCIYGGQAFFLSCYDVNGNYQWTRSFSTCANPFGCGGQNYTSGKDLVVDPSGNILVTGAVSFSKPGILNGPTTACGTDVFIAKYNAQGAFIWGRNMGTNGIFVDEGKSIALDNAGNIYLTGFLSPGVHDFGIPPLNSYFVNVQGYGSFFLARYDSSGLVTWVNVPQPSGNGVSSSEAANLIVGSSGQIYIAGKFISNGGSFSVGSPYDSLDFDFGPGEYWLSSPGGSLGFICQYQSNGNLVWAKPLKEIQVSGGGIFPSELTLNSSQQLLSTWNFNGSNDIDFDPGPGLRLHGPSDSSNSAVVVYDLNGQFIKDFSMNTWPGINACVSTGMQTIAVCGWNASINDMAPSCPQWSIFPSSGFLAGYHFTTQRTINLQMINSLCKSDSFNLNYSTDIKYNSGNIFYLEMSDFNGNFHDPDTIGQLLSDTSGIITGFVPGSISTASGYRLRVVASNPFTIGCGTTDFQLNDIATVYVDADGDGWDGGTVTDCFPQPLPVGYSWTTAGADCNDSDSLVNPGVTEICNNAIDDNCNLSIDEGCTNYLSVTIKCFIEGLYLGGGMMMETDPLQPGVADSIKIEIYDSSSLALLYSETVVLSVAGLATINVPLALTYGNCYLVIRHRNAIETWYKWPVNLQNTSYLDFTY
jgi:hypothetical protein